MEPEARLKYLFQLLDIIKTTGTGSYLQGPVIAAIAEELDLKKLPESAEVTKLKLKLNNKGN